MQTLSISFLLKDMEYLPCNCKFRDAQQGIPRQESERKYKQPTDLRLNAYNQSVI